MPAKQASRTRQYRSPLRARRAAETRGALLDAARKLFVERGWAGTGMRDVAAEAGVATETLYVHFASKRALLQAVVDVSVVGDAEPIAVAERPDFARMGTGSHRNRTAAGAHLLTGIYERTASMSKVIREAAASDPEMSEVLRDTRERQRSDVAASVALMLGRPATPTERDGLWALTSPEVYELLVDVSGWTPAQYEQWMATTLEQVLRPETPKTARRSS
jgi:AcrR family transcriptional regulator